MEVILMSQKNQYSVEYYLKFFQIDRSFIKKIQIVPLEIFVNSRMNGTDSTLDSVLLMENWQFSI